MNIEKEILNLREKTAELSGHSQDDYYAEDGLLRCGKCGGRKEIQLFACGRIHTFPCICTCEQEEIRLREEKMQQEEALRNIEHLKSAGLTDRRFREWRFENDTGKNPKLPLAQKYVENWPQMRERNIGILLSGPVGTGKSFFAGCIANALLEQGIPVLMTNFPRILNELTKYGTDRNQVIENLVAYPLLIIDDLGIERNSGFALEQIYSIVDRRYCSMKPLIVTTNLTLDEMKDADLEHGRVYSRIFEMCARVTCEGKDIRMGEGKRKTKQMRRFAGLPDDEESGETEDGEGDDSNGLESILRKI